MSLQLFGYFGYAFGAISGYTFGAILGYSCSAVFMTTSMKQTFKYIQCFLFRYFYNMEIWLIYQGLLNLEAKTSFTEFKRGALLSISSSSGYKTSFILKIFSSFQLKFPFSAF